ncbi:MAG: hypothetical protein ACLR23_28400 [Clostridia bacterium]
MASILKKTMTTDCYYGIPRCRTSYRRTTGRRLGQRGWQRILHPGRWAEPSIDALQLLHQAAGELLKVTVSI